MELATNRGRFSPRLNPLAACLAAALALSAGSAAANPGATSQQQLQARELASLPARMMDGSVPRPPPWQRQTPLPPLSERHHPVPHEMAPVPAGAIAVTNCDDSGAGSLRDALENVAVDGDTVDLTGLSCSTITLTTGSIFFFQDSITIQGPGLGGLILTGGPSRYPPLMHGGLGTLSVNGMIVMDGAKYFTDSQVVDARGGCIFSGGYVALNDSEVKYCTAQNSGSTYGALGGAVYGTTGVSLSNSTIFGSSAYAANTFGDGGAIFTPGSVTLLDSFISGNTASNGGGGVRALDGGILKYSQVGNNEAATVGGVYIMGNATILYSTIAGNVAGLGGGLWLNGSGATIPVTLANSTVSGNNAANSDIGGIFLYGGGQTARVANSTIAFNTTHFAGSTKYGAGLRSILSTIDLESNIIAGNTNDSGGGAVNDDVDGSASVTLIGANNLIVVSSITPPADTISADPKLGELESNGGETQTHAIHITSPAINAGNNEAGAATDQRGSGYPRVIGGQADIGAFEFDFDDVIFRNGFD